MTLAPSPISSCGKPVWADELVIYELNPTTFTSPSEPGKLRGSGTFASLGERLEYLHHLGVNGIWMAGHCPATAHFYNTWSVYATVRPDRVDDELGGEAGLRELTDKARQLGIHIFLEVVSHGVVRESPLVGESPGWFHGGSWEMVDYDYDDPGFRKWWVDTWLRYAVELGIDGFRVDIGLQRRELWDEIVVRCASEGHPVVVFPESGRYHFSQQDARFDDPRAVADWSTSSARTETLQISCHDRGWRSPVGNYYRVRASRGSFAYAVLGPRIPLFFAGEEFDATQNSLPGLSRCLYGGGGPGGWLYGTVLDWSNLDIPHHADMLEDCRELLSVRKKFSELFAAAPDRKVVHRLPTPGLELDPYLLRVRGAGAMVVLANIDSRPARAQVRVPLDFLGPEGAALRESARKPGCATDALTGGVVDSRLLDEVLELSVPVPADFERRGGWRAVFLREG
jgi:hypothetical protein